MSTPSPKLQCTGPQRESGSVVDRRQPGEELCADMKNTAGTTSRGWLMTDRGGGASLLPYTPAGVTVSDDDNDETT